MMEGLFHDAPVDMDDLNAHLKLLGADICDIDTKIQERLEAGVMMAVDKVQRVWLSSAVCLIRLHSTHGAVGRGGRTTATWVGTFNCIGATRADSYMRGPVVAPAYSGYWHRTASAPCESLNLRCSMRLHESAA